MKGTFPAKTKAPTAFEAEILGIVLLELRRSVKLRAQLTVIIDPFVAGGGAHIFAAPNEAGRTYTVEGRTESHGCQHPVTRMEAEHGKPDRFSCGVCGKRLPAPAKRRPRKR